MRPMLAGKFDEKLQRFPALVSPKLDGIRAIVDQGVVYSRSWKPIPNRYVQQLFGRPEFQGFDGELIVGQPTQKNCMQATTSGVMSYDGQPNVTYWVFDQLPADREHYERRLALLSYRFACPEDFELEGYLRVQLVPQHLTHSLEQLYGYEEQYLLLGYEGLIVRDPKAEYKQGRGTTRAGDMLKLKRFTDAEAVILGAVELMHNANEARLDERGYTKRSSSQEGKIPMGLLGALRCSDPKTGQEFEVGTGFTELDRVKLWQNRECLPGQIIKYKHFSYGQKDKPRQPVFLGFRHQDDL